jgi:hypothetical protein
MSLKMYNNYFAVIVQLFGNFEIYDDVKTVA